MAMFEMRTSAEYTDQGLKYEFQNIDRMKKPYIAADLEYPLSLI